MINQYNDKKLLNIKLNIIKINCDKKAQKKNYYPLNTFEKKYW